MKILFATLLALSMGCACSARHLIPFSPLTFPITADPSISILTPLGGAGHACPVNDVVITATHVVTDEQGQLVPYMMYSYNGVNGLVQYEGQKMYGRDVSLLTLLSGDVSYLPTGEVAKPGDVVYWYEYDFRTVENGLRGRLRVAAVLRVVAGHYVLDGVPVGGASGSCLLNTRGEVIGLVISSFETARGNGVGMAVLIPKDISK